MSTAGRFEALLSKIRILAALLMGLGAKIQSLTLNSVTVMKWPATDYIVQVFLQLPCGHWTVSCRDYIRSMDFIQNLHPVRKTYVG